MRHLSKDVLRFLEKKFKCHHLSTNLSKRVYEKQIFFCYFCTCYMQNNCLIKQSPQNISFLPKVLSNFTFLN